MLWAQLPLPQTPWSGWHPLICLGLLSTCAWNSEGSSTSSDSSTSSTCVRSLSLFQVRRYRFWSKVANVTERPLHSARAETKKTGSAETKKTKFWSKVVGQIIGQPAKDGSTHLEARETKLKAEMKLKSTQKLQKAETKLKRDKAEGRKAEGSKVEGDTKLNQEAAENAELAATKAKALQSRVQLACAFVLFCMWLNIMFCCLYCVARNGWTYEEESSKGGPAIGRSSDGAKNPRTPAPNTEGRVSSSEAEKAASLSPKKVDINTLVRAGLAPVVKTPAQAPPSTIERGM